MRISAPRPAFLTAMLMVTTASSTALGQSVARPPAPTPSSHGQAATSAVTYLSDSSAFVTGKTVYLRSTKTRIGIIEGVDADHRFPSKFSRRHMSAVLIHWKDGPIDWIPVEGITRIYVVGK